MAYCVLRRTTRYWVPRIYMPYPKDSVKETVDKMPVGYGDLKLCDPTYSLPVARYFLLIITENG